MKTFIFASLALTVVGCASKPPVAVPESPLDAALAQAKVACHRPDAEGGAAFMCSYDVGVKLETDCKVGQGSKINIVQIVKETESCQWFLSGNNLVTNSSLHCMSDAGANYFSKAQTDEFSHLPPADAMAVLACEVDVLNQ